jgi:hypothetical protein
VPGTVDDTLFAVSTTSSRNAWAVGNDDDMQGFMQTLALHWNGTAWKDVASPSPNSFGNDLSSVTVISPHNVWAVGFYDTGSDGTGFQNTLALHCC